MCECCILPICCSTAPVNVEKPVGCEEPPEKLHCPRCGEINKPVFRQNRKTCSLCFIPCCCCSSAGDPIYLACSNCNFMVGQITGEKCKNCGVTTASESKYCPNCGKSRSRSIGIISANRRDRNMNSDTEDKKSPRGKRIGEFNK